MSQEVVGILPADELDRIIGHHTPNDWKIDIAEHIIKNHAKYGLVWAASLVLEAGIIIGIRQERARRNKSERMCKP